MVLTRRDFLIAGGSTLFSVLFGASFSGKLVYDFFSENEKDKKQYIWDIYRIYHQLPYHIYDIKVRVDCIDKDKKINLMKRGMGIILNNKVLTLAHITKFKHCNTDLDKLGVKLYSHYDSKLKSGIQLEREIIDYEKDLAIFKIPKNIKVEDFPCIPSEKISLGEEVYILGNPGLKGFNIRRAYISDLDGVDGDEKTYNCFGIDKTIIPGDSGTPVINSKFELVGLVQEVHWQEYGGLGYVKKIGEFLKNL